MTISPTESLLEVAGNERRAYSVENSDGGHSILKSTDLKDTRQMITKLKDDFMIRFFPLGYPDSVSDGFDTYAKYRAMQHVVRGVMGVMSTQSLLFAAGLRPTPAQATIVSWVLKDGMAHVGKLACSVLGTRMDAEPKRWRVFADLIQDIGVGLEIMSPLCPQQFLAVAGLANVAKGIALVAGRSTRLPIYTAFACQGNLSDLYAKGEALSVVCNAVGLAIGVQLSSSVCSTTQGKLLAFPVLSAIHLYCITAEMREAPLNFLNPQRTGMLVADFLKEGRIPKPTELRYRERLVLSVKPNPLGGSVTVGTPIRRAIRSTSELRKLRSKFQNKKFMLSFRRRGAELILHKDATGEDAVEGWLVAACVAEIVEGQLKDMTPFQPVYSVLQPLRRLRFGGGSEIGGQTGSDVRRQVELKQQAVEEALVKTEKLLPTFLEGLKENGWHTHLFLEGKGVRAIW